MVTTSRDTEAPRRSHVAATVLVVASLVWIGALLGVSFLATPVKFLAPSLSLPVALDVGRQTFLWFGRVETVFALVCLTAAVVAGRPRSSAPARPFPLTAVLALVLLAGVVLQRLWLLPQLDARVDFILQGAVPPASRLHDVYVVVEVVKLGVLCVLAGTAIASLRAR